MAEKLKEDSPITRVTKLVYEVEGKTYEATPASEAEADELTKMVSPLAANCSGEYTCWQGWRWRWMFDHYYKQCRWFRTNEVC